MKLLLFYHSYYNIFPLKKSNSSVNLVGIYKSSSESDTGWYIFLILSVYYLMLQSKGTFNQRLDCHKKSKIGLLLIDCMAEWPNSLSWTVHYICHYTTSTKDCWTTLMSCVIYSDCRKKPDQSI